MRCFSYGVRWMVAAALAVMFLAAPVRAQFGMGGGDVSQFTFPVTKRDVGAYAKLLALTAEQREAALALHEGYSAGVKAVREEMRKAMHELQEKVADSGDWGSYREAGKIFQPLGERMEKLEANFFADLKTLLNGEQADRFVKVERMRRRDKNMKFAMISGTRVDLVQVLEVTKIEPSASPSLAEQVEAYEADLDRALTVREQAQKALQEKGEKAGEAAMSGNMAALTDMFKAMQDADRPVRDLNKSYARRIEELVPEDRREAFAAEVRRRMFPRVYRDSYIVKAMTAAAGFDDLTSDQSKSLADLKAQYERDAAPINARWAAAIEERDNKGFNPMAMFPGGGGDGKDNPIAEPRKARRDLDKQVRTRLESILSDAQKDRLPRDDRNMQEDYMDMMGFDIDPEIMQGQAGEE
jgi:hypothetical protein